VDDLPQFYNLVILRDNFADESDNESVFTQANAITYLNEVVLQLCDTYYDGDDEVLRFLSSLNVPGYVSESLVLDPHTTQQVKRSRLESVSLTKGMIQKGQLIVSRGEMVNDEKFHIVWSLKKEYSSHTTSLGLFWVILGQSVLVGFCLMVLFLFLANYKKHLLRKSKDLMLMLLLMVGSIWIARLSLIFDVFSVYLIPFVIVPILLKNFFDSRVALFNHILNILMLGLIVPNAFEFLFIQLIAGFVGVFHLNNFYKRGSLTATAALVFVMYVVSFTAYSLWQEGNIAKVNFSMYWWFGGNGLLVLISFPAIYIFERLFGYISDLTLIELSNANNPLLLELAEKAPGTFQHSLQVANLSESAAFAVGANPLLLRTGAMYHDIGKMAMPQYFVENQISNINPHDKISFEKSAEIIISHVTRGVEIAKKHNIPPVIIDFIRTHHGTSKAQYFYRMYQQQFPDRETNPEKFTYPGPKPSTRETAILMMADAVEAASRSLRDISEKSIGELIEKIISFQMREGQFEEADITFREIRIIKRIFLRKMLNIYHARIEYPEEKKA
jgi:putative nucleotidyltransferase with HDIG domain